MKLAEKEPAGEPREKKWTLPRAPLRPRAREENLVRWRDCRVTVLSPRLFRIERGGEASFCDEATQSVWYRDAPPVPFGCGRRPGPSGEEELCIETAEAVLLLRPDFWESELVLGTERVKLGACGNLKGTARTLDMLTDGRVICDDADGTRRYVPYRDASLLADGVCSRSGVALFEDSDSLILGEDGRLHARPAAEDRYVFAFGHDYRAAVRALFSLCGKPPLLPRFVFGNWWSRYWAYSEESYLSLLDEFAARGIPLSVATVDMDWHYVDVKQDFELEERGLTDEAVYGEAHGWTGYTWNKKLFPNYAEFLRALKARGLAVTLNLHPASGVRWWEEQYPEMARRMGLDPETKRVIPFDLSDDRFLEAYFEVLHRPYERAGVDFWWIDWQQGARSRSGDPLWSLNHYHALDRAAQGKRALVLSRYAGMGSHRYPLGFSGDTVQTWDLLDFMPYFTACAANAGYQFWSHDVGGHHAGEKCAELYLRWLEFAVFNPILRLHSSSGPLFGKEPWNYGEGACAAAVRWLRFRAALVPWLYTQAREASETGRGLLEPMYYDDPEAPEAYEFTGQYRFGGLLVAPVTRPADGSGLGEKRTWLPPGEWYDLFSGLSYGGGRILRLCRRPGEIPVFCRPGTILPLAVGTENGTKLPEALEVRVYPGEGTFTLYEDEGEGTDDRHGAYCETRFSLSRENGTWRLTISPEGDLSVLPETRRYLIKLMGTEQTFERVTSRGERAAFSFPVSRPPVRERVLRELFAFLSVQEGENAVLGVLWEKLSGADTRGGMLAAVRGAKLPRRVRTRLRELILAPSEPF